MMPRWLGFILFVSIFAGICLGGYYYILARLFSFFKLRQNLVFWLLLVVLAFGYIGFSMLQRKLPCGLSEWLLRFSALALGIGWICLVVLVSHDVLYLIFRFPIQISRWAVLGVILLLTGYSLFNAMRIEVNTIELPAPVDVKLVQLSDIHFGSVTQGHLRRLIEMTNALHPDGVLFTGDLVDSPCSLTPEALAPLNDLTAPAWWVTGNHERYLGVSNVMDALKTTSIQPLRNEAAAFSGIQLIGIDDSENHTQIEEVLPKLTFDPAAYTILLYHRPDGLDAAAKAGVDLMLTGHTHNGQIWPFNRVVKNRFKYIKGLHQIENMALFISTGSGTWGPPMRLGSRNQITLLHLKKND